MARGVTQPLVVDISGHRGINLVHGIEPMTTHKDNGGLPHYSPMIAPKYKELVTSSARLHRRAPKTGARSKSVSKSVSDAKQ